MIAILTTHPIQYQVPLWQALAKDGAVPFEVWYLSDHGTRPSFDRQFDKTFAWDIDLLSGYPYRFLKVNRGAEVVGGFRKLRLAEPLRERLRAQRVEALWLQGWQVLAYWQAVREARAAGVPVWLRGESNDLSVTAGWKRPLKSLLLSQLFKRVDSFLYIGSANRRLYESYGARPGQLHPAPYCVDNERFAAQAERLRPERAAIRREWNIPEDAFCVLFAGKFITKKCPLDLVMASRDTRLRKMKRGLHLLFVGSGELGVEMRGACRVVYDAARGANPLPVNESLDDGLPRASFTGFLNQQEISKAYAAADCLVLPSDQGETWGLVVNEAMAGGLPCAVSDACGCGEDLVAPVHPALRFPLGDHRAIADALLYVAGHPCLSSACRAQVEKFSLSNSVETVRRLYASLNTAAPAGHLCTQY